MDSANAKTAAQGFTGLPNIPLPHEAQQEEQIAADAIAAKVATAAQQQAKLIQGSTKVSGSSRKKGAKIPKLSETAEVNRPGGSQVELVGQQAHQNQRTPLNVSHGMTLPQNPLEEATGAQLYDERSDVNDIWGPFSSGPAGLLSDGLGISENAFTGRQAAFQPSVGHVPVAHASGSQAASVPLPKFQKDGLDKMYRYNLDVLQKIQEAITELGKDDPNPMRLSDALVDAKTKVTQRLKVIRIADRHGWAAVAIYEGDGDLGEDAEDSKKIKAAAAEAERNKRKADALKQGGQRRGPPTYGSAYAGPGYQGGSYGPNRPFWRRGSWQTGRAHQYPIGPRYPISSPCYICGATTHWARACPQNGGNGQSTMQKKET